MFFITEHQGLRYKKIIEPTGWAKLNGATAVSFVVVKHVLDNFDNFLAGEITVHFTHLEKNNN